MFIVFACREELEIKNYRTIANTALDTKKSRPAVYGQIKYESTVFLDLIGVHLKSKDDKTDLRLKQAKSISEFMKTLNTKTPLVVTGDFNSHSKEKTLNAQDDVFYLQEAFKDQHSKNQLKLAPHLKATYLSSEQEMSLDHFFIKNLKNVDIKVYNLYDYTADQPFNSFYNEISDHVPVSLSFKLPLQS
jgi:endonuclease/exonuclease/phosphatase family metal-dependent hydrolase